MKRYVNEKYEEERALYGIKDAEVISCVFCWRSRW